MSDKTENAMDYPEHESTYELFIAMSKYGSIAVIVILVLMAFFLL
jgi:hypothetical protein